METKYKILLIILGICLIASSALSAVPIKKLCSGETSMCSIVQNSQYESIFGINNSYFGVVGFALLIILLISNSKKPEKYKKLFLNIGITISAVVAIYFIYLQFFVINAICPYCMVVDTGSIISFIIIATIK